MEPEPQSKKESSNLMKTACIRHTHSFDDVGSVLLVDGGGGR